MFSRANLSSRNIEISEQTESFLIFLIILLFLIAGRFYALQTPAFEASDELWHYPMVRHLADGNPLPVQTYNPALAGPWKQEASQPPLYYYVAAGLTFWIDAADMEQVRKLNPHVAPGELTTDGNINMVVHDPMLSQNQGTLLAIRIIRLFSVLLGACTVWLTYLIGREVAPTRPEIALMAAALNAFTPMFLFISGSVNNDNLAIPLASLGLLLLIRLVKFAKLAYPQVPVPWRDEVNIFHTTLVRKILIIGTVVGFAVLTKQGTIGLMPLAWGTFFIVGWLSTLATHSSQNQSLDMFSRQIGVSLLRSVVWFLIFMVPIVLIAGWWYGRNIQLYGDLLGWSAFEAVLGVRETPASIGQLWDERWGFMLSYWGQFGGLNVVMADWIYRTMTAILIISVPGGVWYVVRQYQKSRWWRSAFRNSGRGYSVQKVLGGIINLIISRFALTVCLLFSAAIVYGLVTWATKTWSSQGRLVFTAMSALNVLMAAGLVTILRHRYLRYGQIVIVAFFAIVSFSAPFTSIAPAYELPPNFVFRGANVDWVERLETEADAVFDNELKLVGAEITSDKQLFSPGETVSIHTDWQVVSKPQTDWSVFVHLNDPVLGVPVAQRDMFLAQGLVATTFMRPGKNYQSRFDLTLPDTTIAPAELEVTIGLYNFYTGERAILPDGADHVVIGSIKVEPLAGETPNPVSINFENKFELVGFELDPRRTAAGESITGTFYWKLTEAVSADFTFYGQILGAENTRWAAVDAGQTTTGWEVGKIYPVEMKLDLSSKTPAGVYPLRLGVYSTATGEIVNLQRVTEDGRLTDSFINLTQIRID
ncbi:MAG: glycosyltransferase family 39 protein [Anaerolineae bacterium]